MIEDKELGLKVATDQIEAVLQDAKANAEKRIAQMTVALDIEKVALKRILKKLKKYN